MKKYWGARVVGGGFVLAKTGIETEQEAWSYVWQWANDNDEYEVWSYWE